MVFRPNIAQMDDGGSSFDATAFAPAAPVVPTATATPVVSSPPSTISGMTQEQVLVKTAEQVAAGITSTSKAAKLGDETSSEANARLTAAYREMIAKPILSPEQEAAGGEVRWVRSGGAGRGEYRVIMPIGSRVRGDATAWTVGIIPSYSEYITGTTLGMWSNGDGTVTNIGEVPVTTITKAGEVSTRSFEGQDAYYTAKVGTTGKTQAQLDAAMGQDKALQLNKDIAALLGGTIDPATGKVTNVAGKFVTSIVPNADGTTTITASDGSKMNVKTPVAPAATTDIKDSNSGAIAGKTISRTVKNPDGSTTYFYTDGTSSTAPAVVPSNNAINNGINTSGTRTVVSTSIDPATGKTIAKYSDGSTGFLDQASGPTQTQEFKDAYSLLEQTFRDYGLESLVPAIKGFMARNLGAQQAAVELRTTPEYIARFKGNDVRRATGKNALSEAEYLAIEDAYDQTLRAYGQQNYFGINRAAKQAKAAELIGNDISAVEFKDRIQLAVDRVQNADPTIKSVLKQFYPGINESDLVGYFLNPADNLPKLKEKVTASEIGAAATGVNLSTDVTAATDLARYGVTQEQARRGYTDIAEVLPTATKLGDIYNETGVKYAQKEAEAEVFKGNQDAATKRKRLASMERAAFGGSSGVNQKTLDRSSQGLI